MLYSSWAKSFVAIKILSFMRQILHLHIVKLTQQLTSDELNKSSLAFFDAVVSIVVVDSSMMMLPSGPIMT